MSKKANAQEMRRIITTIELGGDQLLLLNDDFIRLWITACENLMGVLKTEEMLLSGVDVIAKVKDDINMTTKNLTTLKAVDKLKELKLTEFISLS